MVELVLLEEVLVELVELMEETVLEELMEEMVLMELMVELVLLEEELVELVE